MSRENFYTFYRFFVKPSFSPAFTGNTTTQVVDYREFCKMYTFTSNTIQQPTVFGTRYPNYHDSLVYIINKIYHDMSKGKLENIITEIVCLVLGIKTALFLV